MDPSRGRALRYVAPAAAVLLALALAGSLEPGYYWHQLTSAALGRFEELAGERQPAHSWAYAAGAAAALRGWHDQGARAYLAKLEQTRQENGGFGLDTAFDAFRDGSLNPADTTYTITLTDHVGRVLLDAWHAGAVPRDEIEQLVDVLLAMPSSQSASGVCYAYSDQAADLGPCVVNVNAAAALFLSRARGMGFDRPGLSVGVAAIVHRDAAAFDNGWPYIEGEAMRQRLIYNALNAEAHLQLNPKLGDVALAAVFAQPDAAWTDPLGRMRLVPYRCDRARGTLVDAVHMLMDPRVDARVLAELSYWSARVHCGP